MSDTEITIRIAEAETRITKAILSGVDTIRKAIKAATTDTEIHLLQLSAQ